MKFLFAMLALCGVAAALHIPATIENRARGLSELNLDVSVNSVESKDGESGTRPFKRSDGSAIGDLFPPPPPPCRHGCE
ncbi:hypothetical protein OH77DRAFT_1520993 [Trametes cingulata]|nr:hypothetical protein OH77DRAFT_1520993 [Trametes cingulata]